MTCNVYWQRTLWLTGFAWRASWMARSHTRCWFLGACFPLCHSMWCRSWYWCSAGRVKPQVWDSGLPWLRLCVKLPMVLICSGMNLNLSVLLCQFLYFSHFRIVVWFSTPLPNDGSLSRSSATNAPLPVPEFTWHFLPLAEKHSYGAEIKPADSCTMLPWKYLPKSIWDPTLEPSCFLPLV